ncbi:DUF397 domain-containing protein [Streptomyces edwardsiae]|uniref:DUF397 domain-containing protein n=1 Tax=Streptomyces edwardsiae TaxID=3075527 RepID=A0ABU2QBU7_9ACTN|nr:DUF397 domain-containing protein [Streptomyces sp. DSM 41635]MDT0401923.1 DUF397 domain-containing protein [Streptomyces sp. DSM 41635]
MNIDKAVPEADGYLRWHKSSYSSEEGGECVEVAVGSTAVHVRDSKQAAQGGPELKVSSGAWSALLNTM